MFQCIYSHIRNKNQCVRKVRIGDITSIFAKIKTIPIPCNKECLRAEQALKIDGNLCSICRINPDNSGAKINPCFLQNRCKRVLKKVFEVELYA